MEAILVIGIAGFIGANVRYFVAIWVTQSVGSAFPWSTLIINLTGSGLLAVFTAWAGNQIGLDPRIRLFIAVGFFGAYTTFSTYANESIGLFRAGDWIGSFGNIMLTNILCLIAAFIGLLIGSRL